MTDEWIGKTLSKVIIERKLGRGGMAEIYLGRHTTLDRPVAVKILHGYLADDVTLRDRTQQEARAIASLRHPNIVQVLDFDIASGQPYIVMELLDGISLYDFLKAHHEAGFSLPLPHILRVLHQIASALDYAHQNRIIHRDIKPSNVMLRQGQTPLRLELPLPSDAQVVLTDFGIARITGATRHTSDGTILGTPHYMSPEQVNGTEIDARTDIYAMGIMAYEMLAGKVPFGTSEDTPAAILYRQVHEAPPRIPNTADSIQAVIFKCLAKEKEDRFNNAGAFINALEVAAANPDSARAPTLALDAGGRCRRTGFTRLRPLLLGTVGLTLLTVLFFGARSLFNRPASAPALATQPPVPAASQTSMSDAAPPAVQTDVPGQLLHGTMRIDEGDLVLRFSEPLPILNRPLAIRLRTSEGRLIELGEESDLAGGVDYFLTTPDGSSVLGTTEAIIIVTFLETDAAGVILGEGRIPPDVQADFQILENINASGDQEDRILGGVNSQTSHFQSHLGFTLRAIEDGNFQGARSHAEHTINILSGAAGEFYGDWNGNELIENPGDDVGLLTYLDLILHLLSNPLASPDEAQASTAREVREQLTALRSEAEVAVSLVRQVALADSLEIIHELNLDQQLAGLNLSDRLAALMGGIDTLDLGFYLDF